MKRVLGLILLLCAALCVSSAIAENNVWNMEEEIDERVAIAPPVLTGPETVLTCQRVEIVATAPGATKIHWFIEFSDGYKSEREETLEDGRAIYGITSLYPKTLYVRAQVYKDGKWSELSEACEVEIRAPYGMLPIPKMESIPFDVIEGEDLTLYVEFTEGKQVGAYVELWVKTEDEDGYWPAIWNEEINESGSMTIPGSLLKAEDQYVLTYNFSSEGYEGVYIYSEFTVKKSKSAIETDNCVSVSDTSFSVMTGENASFTFSARGALAWAVYYSTGEGEWECMEEFSNLPYPVAIDEMAELSEEELRFCTAGDTIAITTDSAYTTCTEYYCARAYLPTGWTKPSPIVGVMSYAPYGNLLDPDIQLVGELEVGKPVTIDYTLPMGTEIYLLQINRADWTHIGYEWFYDGDPAGKRGRYTFPAQIEQEGNIDLVSGSVGTEYVLTVCALGRGYDQSSIQKRYTIGESAPLHIDLILPDDLVEIEASAFEGDSSITTVKCPAGLKRIGARAFANCESLTLIQVPKGAEIEASAFEGCDEELEIQRY